MNRDGRFFFCLVWSHTHAGVVDIPSFRPYIKYNRHSLWLMKQSRGVTTSSFGVSFEFHDQPEIISSTPIIV